jgi:hypothetical protein
MRDLVSDHVVINALRAVEGISCPPAGGSRGNLDYVMLQHDGRTLAQAVARPLNGHRPHHARLKLRGSVDARRLPREATEGLEITESGVVIVEEQNIAGGARLIEYLVKRHAHETPVTRYTRQAPSTPKPSPPAKSAGREGQCSSVHAGSITGVTEPSRFRPCPQLVGILAPAFEPCRHFAGHCAGIARWDPGHGHVPRGFTGAFGTLDDIELVLVVAEPGDPFPEEHYDPGSSPIEHIEKIAKFSFEALNTRDQFNVNFRGVLNDCWPGLSPYAQMRRTWKAESYLCSAPREGGSVPRSSWSVCGRDYLKPQLLLLADRAIVACGSKARDRIRALGFTQFLEVPALAPPGVNQPGAREKHREIPEYLEKYNAKRRRH